MLSHVRLFATPWTVACQAPLFMGFSRQEYWSWCHALLQGVLLIQGSKLLLRGNQKCDMKYFFLSKYSQIMIDVCVSYSVVSDSLRPPGL